MDKNLYLKIQRPSDKCLNCGADLVAAHKHPSGIRVDDKEENLERKDYCPECWAQLKEEDRFSLRWLAKREIPLERTRISRQDRNRLLLALFELLSAGGDLDQSAETVSELDREATRYFLGHLLMRFRVFRWHRTEADSGRIFFENVQTGESYGVNSVELNDEMIVRVKQVVEDYLRKGQDLDVSL